MIPSIQGLLAGAAIAALRSLAGRAAVGASVREVKRAG
jgi:hypothetical protein